MSHQLSIIFISVNTFKAASIQHTQTAADKGLPGLRPIQPSHPQRYFSSPHPQSIQSSTPEHSSPSNNFNLSYGRSGFKLCVQLVCDH